MLDIDAPTAPPATAGGGFHPTPEDLVLLRGFEDGTLESFPHRAHVHLAWLYLQREPAGRALDRFSAGLRRFAERKGADGLYHETVTWAYLLLIRERMARGPDGTGWQSFAAANPDLLRHHPSPLAAYYRPQTLGSDLARRTFVLPDRGLAEL